MLRTTEASRRSSISTTLKFITSFGETASPIALSEPMASDLVILPNPSGVASKRPFTVRVSKPNGLLKRNDSELECIATSSAPAACVSKPSTIETLTRRAEVGEPDRHRVECAEHGKAAQQLDQRLRILPEDALAIGGKLALRAARSATLSPGGRKGSAAISS